MILTYSKMLILQKEGLAHRFRNIRLSLIFSIFIFGVLNYPATLMAQHDSLYQYLEIAAKNNPGVMQKFMEYEAALQKIPQVGSLPDPELNVGIFLSPMELIAGKQVADIRLMQMFPWFGVLKNARDEMSLMAKAKYESFQDVKLQVFYDVQRTWYELYKVQMQIHIADKNNDILHSLERLALVRFKSVATGKSNATPSNPVNVPQTGSSGSSGSKSMGGNGSSSSGTPPSSMQSGVMGSSAGNGSSLTDLYRIQMDIGELDNNIALLKNMLTTVTARFNGYINRPMRTPVAIVDTLTTDTLGMSLNMLSDSMLANNPMLGMLVYEQQSYDARKKMVTRMGYPMVGLGVNYTLINKSDMSASSMNGRDMIMPMVTVTLPLYRRKYRAMSEEADLMKNASAQNYQAVSNTLQTEFYEALQMYQDAQRRMTLYDNQCLLADKALNIDIKSFSTSGSGLADILKIRQQMLDYEFKHVEAVVDFNTAISWLKRLGNIELNSSHIH